MKRTKKLGSVARFGARYGRKEKKAFLAIEKVLHKKHICPRCNYVRVKRVGTGIWACRKCDFTFAGGAYAPTTAPGISAQRQISKITESLNKER